MGLHADDWFQIRPRPASEVLATFAGDWNTGTRNTGGFYRPLIRVSFAIDQRLYGLHPTGYHFTNALIFGSVLAAIYAIGLQLFPNQRAGLLLIITTAFAFNPIKNEALYWVSGRTDLLAAAFVLWSFFLTLRAVSIRSIVSAILALLFLLFALLTKEIAISACLILPIATLLFTPYPQRRAVEWTLIIAPIALGAAYFLFRSSVLGGLAGYTNTEPRGVGQIFTNLSTMLSALFWPWQTNGPAVFQPLLALPGLILVLSILTATRFRRGILAPFLAMIIALLPMAFLSISPVDGTRVLFLPLAFQTLLIAAIFLGIGLPLWLRPAVGVVAVLFLASLQRDNIGITLSFISARTPNESYLASAWEIVENAPADSIIILPEPRRQRDRRILDSGASLALAMETYWKQQPDTTTGDTSELSIPRISMEFKNPEKAITTAVILQPWMKENIISLYQTDSFVYGKDRLHRTSLQTIAHDQLSSTNGIATLELPVGEQRFVIESIMEETGTHFPQVVLSHPSGVHETLRGISIIQGVTTYRWISSLAHASEPVAEIRWKAAKTSLANRLKFLKYATYETIGKRAPTEQ